MLVAVSVISVLFGWDVRFAWSGSCPVVRICHVLSVH